MILSETGRDFRRVACVAILFAAGLLISRATRGQQTIGWKPSVSVDINVKAAELATLPVGKNWPSYNGDYSGQRFSSLDQINGKNVASLRAQWAFHAPNSDSLEVTPVVVNGMMFVTSANDAWALDAQTGRIVWHHARPITEGLIDDASQHHNRGVGVWGSSIFMETDNAHLLCLDARSGHLRWDVAYTDGNRNYGATSAPLVVNGKSAGGNFGRRRRRARFYFGVRRRDRQTGMEILDHSGAGRTRFGELAGRQLPARRRHHLDARYFRSRIQYRFLGHQQSSSRILTASVRPGDDLYTDCVLALDADTGKLKWYFQFTPHDLFDYDAEETPVLIDAMWQGQPRKLLVEANRNGFYTSSIEPTGNFFPRCALLKR